MRYIVNDKEVEGLTTKNADSPILARVVEQAKGVVMAPQDGTRAYVRRNSRLPAPRP